MTRLLAFFAAAAVAGCTPMMTLRGSSNDFLKRKATVVTLNSPEAAVTPVLDQLFFQRGFTPVNVVAGEKRSKVIVYKGTRPVPPEVAAYGVQLGSWFAARVTTMGNTTEVMVLGKPAVGAAELCSDADDLFRDVKYTCIDTRVPEVWAGKNLVSGRDETEVVSWVLNGLYERLKN